MATAFIPHITIFSENNKFGTSFLRNANAGDSLKPSRVYLLRRSQLFGEGNIGFSSRLSLHFPETQLVGPSRTRSCDWCLCVVDHALVSRSSSFLSQDLRRGRTKVRTARCLGTQAGAGGMALKPLLDQVLLLGTIFGVYIAGVASLPRLPQLFPNRGRASAGQDTAVSQKSAKRNPIRKQNPKTQSLESSGEDGGWSSLRSKLYQAISLETTEVEDEHVVKSPMLGLQAIARIPRLQLLLTSLQHLRKEAG